MKKDFSLQEIENYLNELLHVKMFEEKAYNGIQIEAKRPINKIVTAVSVSKEIIQKTIDMQAQALVVHHGIFRKGDAHPLIGRIYDYVYQLMSNSIGLLCYHLPLDAHQELGNNWKAAKDLGLKNCVPCVSFNGNNIGVMGQAEDISFDDFRKHVELYYGRGAQFVKVRNTVKNVAIISGGGDRFIKEVADIGADCFITGRVDEHVWDYAQEYGVSFLGLGHYATEVVGARALAVKLEQHFKIPAIFIKTDNPF